MGFLATATTIAGKGTVLVANPDTAPPTNWDTFDPTGDLSATAPGWATLGHTSRDTPIALAKNGGDATVNGSWWNPNLRTDHSATNWSMTVSSLQADAITFGLAFGGGTVDTTKGSYDVGDTVAANKAVFVLIVDTNTGSRMALYVPSTSVAIGNAPSFPVDKFFEIELGFTIQNSVVTGKKFRWYHPALKVVVPTITSALPASAAAGATVTLVGTGFTSATAVTIGGVAATSFAIQSDTGLTFVVPAGTAGSAPIVVVNGAGSSAAFAYTRG